MSRFEYYLTDKTTFKTNYSTTSTISINYDNSTSSTTNYITSSDVYKFIPFYDKNNQYTNSWVKLNYTQTIDPLFIPGTIKEGLFDYILCYIFTNIDRFVEKQDLMYEYVVESLNKIIEYFIESYFLKSDIYKLKEHIAIQEYVEAFFDTLEIDYIFDSIDSYIKDCTRKGS